MKHTLYNIYRSYFRNTNIKIKHGRFLDANIFMLLESEEDYWWMMGFDNKIEEEGWFVQNATRTNVLWKAFKFFGKVVEKVEGVLDAGRYKDKN